MKNFMFVIIVLVSYKLGFSQEILSNPALPQPVVEENFFNIPNILVILGVLIIIFYFFKRKKDKKG